MNIFRIIVGVALLATLNIQAQTRSQAIFEECADNDSPAKCTDDKFDTDITALLTPKITSDLRNNLKEEHFTISIILISDAEGKIIPAETRLLCPPQIENAVKDYIAKLPLFLPKSETLEERRSVHFINLTFIYDNRTESYIEVDQDDLKTFNIKPEMLLLDVYPVYPGCEGFEKDNELKCLSSAMTKFVTKNYRVPDIDYYGKVKMLVYLIIEKDGTINLDKITGGEEPFRYEVRRIIKDLPKIKPGSISNIPIRVACTLPVTINMG
jgi:hypothetical protein